MNAYAELVAGVRVDAELPGREICAQLRGDGGLSLEWAPGYYYRADDNEVAAKLQSLARLLAAARIRRSAQFIRAEGGDVVSPEYTSDPLHQEYFRRLSSVDAEGYGADRRIHLATRGMRDWVVRIRPGTVHSMHEYEFSAGVAEAVRRLWDDQRVKVARLKEEIYR